MYHDKYQVIIIGGGHAGCEAALASSRIGLRTLMLNLSVDNTALMPCNPSIGGPAKGHLVREVSALGGEQARAADASTLMIRWLNTSKGAAVRALRAQCDPFMYSTYYRKLLTSQKNLDVHQDEAVKILTDKSGKVSGVFTRHGSCYEASAVVIAGGVYMAGRVFMGDISFPSGPMGQQNSEHLAKNLADLGIETGKMRTDTTPRLNIHTINFAGMKPQYSEPEPLCFDLWGKEKTYGHDYACWFSRTTEETYAILQRNISRSPLVTGEVEAHGPRYCPSIEDKFLRFPDHITHPIVFEPVSPSNDEVYVQNFSTSLPYDVQAEMIRSLPGCEHTKIIKPGYGIEYTYILPSQLKHTLELKNIPGLFCAGQVNGTSGYEEAAAQGLLAGINAAMFAKGEEGLTLGRDEGYLGVLVDDLTTKSTDEPYRMLTGRCERRLLLRWDNVAHRLARYGRKVGLIDDSHWAFLEKRFERENDEISRLKSTKISPSAETERLCAEYDAENITETMTLAEYLKHRGATYELVAKFSPFSGPYELGREEIAHVETELRYTGYLEREARVAGRMKNLDGAKIPPDFDYDSVKGLRAESLQKLKRYRPESLGHALRISGVTPVDVQLISVILARDAHE